MKYDVTVRIYADSANEAIDFVQSPDFYYGENVIVSAYPVTKEEA